MYTQPIGEFRKAHLVSSNFAIVSFNSCEVASSMPLHRHLAGCEWLLVTLSYCMLTSATALLA
jgi:hypothetical protein